jgi:hypothetical protein
MYPCGGERVRRVEVLRGVLRAWVAKPVDTRVHMLAQALGCGEFAKAEAADVVGGLNVQLERSDVEEPIAAKLALYVRSLHVLQAVCRSASHVLEVAGVRCEEVRVLLANVPQELCLINAPRPARCAPLVLLQLVLLEVVHLVKELSHRGGRARV